MTIGLFDPALASPVQLWLTFLVAGLITYGIRLSFILVFAHWEIPSWLGRALRFVPPAVLTAIIFPELLINQGVLDLTFANLRLLAGLAALLVAWRTRTTLLTILAGMFLLWFLQALG
mgnify:CR=1 FL=1